MADELTVSDAVAELRRIDLFFRGLNVEQLRTRLSRLGPVLDTVERIGRVEAEANQKARQAIDHLAQMEALVAKAQVEADQKIAIIRASYEVQATGIRQHLEKVQAEAEKVTTGAAEAIRAALEEAGKARAQMKAAQADLDAVTASRDRLASDLATLERERAEVSAAILAARTELATIERRVRDRMERLDAAMK